MKLMDRAFKLKHICLAGVLAIAFCAFTYVSIELTNQSTFCGETCHEMDPMYQSWKASAHHDVGCADCHEKPGLMGTIQSKYKGTMELVMHITGNYKTPIVMEHPEDVDCLACHRAKVFTNTEVAAKNKDPHTLKHFSEAGMTCTSPYCHGNVVHDNKMNVSTPSRDRCFTCHLDAMSTLKK